LNGNVAGAASGATQVAPIKERRAAWIATGRPKRRGGGAAAARLDQDSHALHRGDQVVPDPLPPQPPPAAALQGHLLLTFEAAHPAPRGFGVRGAREFVNNPLVLLPGQIGAAGGGIAP